MMNRLERFYQRYLIKALRLQKPIIITVSALFTLAIVLLTRMGGEFIPSLPEGDYAVETRVLPGSNINVSIEAVSKASKIIRKDSRRLKRWWLKPVPAKCPPNRCLSMFRI